MRPNQLVGFSLVIGLNGTGDTESSLLSRKPLQNALERMGMTISTEEIKGRSIAAVMITATLPAFAKQGQRISVTVSSIGDAVSLRGGVLVMTPLRGANRKVFAVAQGLVEDVPLGIELPEGLELLGAEKLITDPYRNAVPTVGRVTNGGIVEKEIDIALNNRTRIYLNLHEPDFTTAFRLSKAINRFFGDYSAKAADAGTVEVSVPQTYIGHTVELISKIENLDIEPDEKARVVIDERTGTIAMGDGVRIMPTAISHQGLSINIMPKDPPPPVEAIQEDEEREQDPEEVNHIFLLRGGVDIKELVDGLNKIGADNSQLISILKTIKDSGAMKAELIIK